MSFRELDIKRSYISYGDENIATSFLVPALKHTKLYRRSVGFFSSSVFAPIIDGIVAMSRNDGNIQLIASPNLNEEDIEAINVGYKKREEIIAGAFERDFIEVIEELDESKLQLLASLIANGTLDIKIAVTNGSGIYHDKLGILEDFDGNTIVFYGSSNSSANGYRNNYEKVRVVKSWIASDLESIEDECKEFDSLWTDSNPHVKVYDYTVSARENILTVVERKRSEAKQSRSAPIKLRDYQQAAIDAWVANNYHGFYVMATGTGKTWTAIFSSIRLMEEHPAMVVICAPYKHLVRQWAEDVVKAVPDAIFVMVSSENRFWESELTQAIVRQRNSKKYIKIIVISTIKSFYSDRFQRTIKKSKQEKLLIVDEAHRFTTRPDELKEQFQYMLGLSATPFSGKDTAKAQELMAFFGGQVFDLPIEKALGKFLVHYYYHPIFVNATEEEETRFRKKSAQIASCFRNGKCIDPENLALHLRSRLRIISMAQEKIDRIEEICETVKEKDHFIVYCGDGRLYDDNDDEIRHIQFVKRKLSDLGYKASQFTASENMAERMDLVESFNEGAIDALAAIRCLDEGINIPSITGALILSSNDDYREFVQRRGRILRTYGNKEYANIYDVIVLPSHETPKMAEIELRRFYEYARLALEPEKLLEQLDDIAAEYGLDLDTFITTFDEGKEAELDD